MQLNFLVVLAVVSAAMAAPQSTLCTIGEAQDCAIKLLRHHGRVESFSGVVGSITAQNPRGFWGRHTRSQLVLCGNFLIYLPLLASDVADMTLAFRPIEGFHGLLQRLKSQFDPASELLVLSVSLRIELFFLQPADQLRVRLVIWPCGCIDPLSFGL
ncbi:thiamine transporter [Colletotrichum tabaci]|uniref:Thiamine transporter n=1 Tax=Colletotrichum tabaci TaxID=1209068 RepID=A0AAV9TQ40_9PEZI